MLYAARKLEPKYVSFVGQNGYQIVSHRIQGSVTYFNYEFKISVDLSTIGRLAGDIVLQVVAAKKRDRSVSVKKSVMTSQNMMKSIDAQRVSQIANSLDKKKIVAKKYVDRPDLSVSQISYQIEIPGSGIGDLFTIEAVNIATNRSETVIDTIEVDHAQMINRYDLPSDDFNLTVTRQGGRSIFASATTRDPNTGAFKFLIKSDAQSSFDYTPFGQQSSSGVDASGNATVVFDVPDSDQKYIIRASPVSRIQQQGIGNFSEFESAFAKSEKKIPFYMASLSDSSVSFSVSSIDQTVSRVMLYRQGISDINREFVESLSNSQNSLTLADSARKPQYEYTYTVDYIDDAGILRSSPSEVIVPALKLDNLAKITAAISTNSTGSNISEISRGREISFDVNVNYNTSTSYDEIVSDLKDLGLESILSNDLEKMTNNLKPITRVLVSRISQKTGDEEMVGVYKTGKISLRNPDTDPCIYRFEVAVRSAPEALELLAAGQSVTADNSFNLKSTVDLASKQIGTRSKFSRSSFSSKFFTRDAIRNSTLKYGNASSLADLGYYAGRTGVFSDVLVPGERISESFVKNITILRTQRGNYLKWFFVGNISQVDHFEIIMDGTKIRSNPISAGIQYFFIGNKDPSKIIITPYVGKTRVESGSSTLGR
jgi:hypothetical protein